MTFLSHSPGLWEKHYMGGESMKQRIGVFASYVLVAILSTVVTMGMLWRKGALGYSNLDQLEGLIEEHQLYGAKYIGLGMMADRYRTPDMFDDFFRDFEEPLQKIHDAGMLFMYHNHALEFGRLKDGRVMMDVMLERFPADRMGITADTYWMQFAGVDVNDWLMRHADRLPCVHLKDMIPDGFTAKMAAVGSGNMNFAAILDTLKHNGVTEYALVEQDDCYGASTFDCLKSSLDYVNHVLGGT